MKSRIGLVGFGVIRFVTKTNFEVVEMRFIVRGYVWKVGRTI